MGFKKRPTITRRTKTAPTPPSQAVDSTTREPDEDELDVDEDEEPDEDSEWADEDVYVRDEDEDDDEVDDDDDDDNEYVRVDDDDELLDDDEFMEDEEDEDEDEGDDDEEEFSGRRKRYDDEDEFLDSIEDFEDDEDDEDDRLTIEKSPRPFREEVAVGTPEDDYDDYRDKGPEEEVGVVEDGPGSVDEYMETLEVEPRQIVGRLRELIREIAPDAKESIKWGMPHYASNGHLLYLDVKRDQVNLGFFRGDELADLAAAKGHFEGAGGKLRHIKIFSAQGIPTAALQELIPAAEKLNQESSDF